MLKPPPRMNSKPQARRFWTADHSTNVPAVPEKGRDGITNMRSTTAIAAVESFGFIFAHHDGLEPSQKYSAHPKGIAAY